MIDKKYQIFVSSTYLDLIEERDTVIKTILNLYHIPIGMEMFSAGDDEQWGVISRTIDTSDYYVVVIGDRYGSTTDTGISYTEKEYDYAVSKGVPVLAFIKNGDGFTPSLKSKSQVQKYAEKQKLVDFREKAMKKYADFWSTKDELSAKLSPALYKIFREKPRTGWIPATQTTADLNDFATATVIEYKKLYQNNNIPYHAYKIKERFIFGINDENESHWILHQAKSNFYLTINDKFKFNFKEIHEDTDGFNGDRIFFASDIWAVDLKM